MPYRQDGVVEDHPRAAPAHDLADGLPHLGLVAMSLAGTAEGLGLHVRAVVHPRIGVVPQGRAVGAELAFRRAVVAAAVQLDHQADRFFLLPALFLRGVGNTAPYNVLVGHQLILPFSTE